MWEHVGACARSPKQRHAKPQCYAKPQRTHADSAGPASRAAAGESAGVVRMQLYGTPTWPPTPSLRQVHAGTASTLASSRRL